eukprot:TRINITY_DN91_c0_g1_i1.p1 TRINITY_DN91_c0_g1~~TRINITY_DN91_c0_g1_i1.p1  ORF type:complete len:520 (-),score=215.14 TRINITY_DN91_c0_g1_i1:467-2026(-)
MSSGKKGRKKTKTLPLNEFLGPSDGVVTIKSGSWADELDESEVPPISLSSVQKVSLPSAPRSSRPLELTAEIPSSPPFTARLSNLSYEIHEELVEEFFAEMKVVSIRLLRENNDPKGRINGTGFVEFEDRESLIQALTMPGKYLMNRPLYIEVSDSYGDPRLRRQRAIEDIKRSLPGDQEDRTTGDWRTSMAKPSSPPSQRYDSRDRRRNNGFGDRYDGGGRGDSRGGDRYEGRSGDRYESRGGDRYESRGGDRYESRGGDRYESRGGDRYDSGGRYGDDRRGDRRDGGGFSNYRQRDGGDRNWGRGDDRGDFNRQRDDYGRRDEDNADSAERPRLILEKRTAPEPVGSVTRGGGSASIFGEAKPVDTSKKEKEIEERILSKKADAPAVRPKPSSSSIFGDAKPVDTTKKEKEIEERLMKMELEKGQLDEGEGEKKRRGPPGGGGGGNRSGGGGSMNHRRDGGGDSRRDYDRDGSSASDSRDKKDSRSPPPPPQDKEMPPSGSPSSIGSNKYSGLEETE